MTMCSEKSRPTRETKLLTCDFPRGGHRPRAGCRRSTYRMSSFLSGKQGPFSLPFSFKHSTDTIINIYIYRWVLYNKVVAAKGTGTRRLRHALNHTHIHYPHPSYIRENKGEGRKFLHSVFRVLSRFVSVSGDGFSVGCDSG